MPYLAVRPAGALADHVEALWLQRDGRLPGAAGWPATTLLPDGRIDLVLGFGDPFLRLGIGGVERPLPPSHVAGLRTRPLAVRPSGRTGLVVVRFHPWAVPRWIRRGAATARELADDVVGTADLGRSTEALERALARAACDGGRLALVESWLRSELADERPDPFLRVAVAWLGTGGLGAEAVRVGELARRLGVGCRTLHQRMTDALGVGPKVYARVLRFQRAVGGARRGRPLATLALDCGYHDQPHLAREVRALGGSPARELVRALAASPLSRFFTAGGATYA